MLHLQADVHLEEEEVEGFGIHEELDGTGTAIAQVLRKTHGGAEQCLVAVCGNARCWRFFDQLLEAALNGAITAAEVDGALAIA